MNAVPSTLDVAALEQAIAAARTAGVASELMVSADARLRWAQLQLEQRSRARTELEAAVNAVPSTLDVAALEQAIVAARTVGVPAKTIAQAATALSNIKQATVSLAVLNDAQRARCLPLLRADQPAAPTDRHSAMVCVAHAAIWAAGGIVYGGFVRDYICGGRCASDVDVSTNNYDHAEQAMTFALRAHGVVFASSQPGGETKAYRRLKYMWRGTKIEVDLVDPRLVPNTSPGVDCSANNLQIDRTSGLALKVPSAASVAPLKTCVCHAQYKQFVFFYDRSAKPYQRRFDKMTNGKGFAALAWDGPPVDGNGLPCSWTAASGLVDVERASAEHMLVASHLAASLDRQSQVQRVQRVQNAVAFRGYHRSGEQTLMFHGCKTQANEDAIVREGFRADLCKSGGRGYGTWFAYASSYSDRSFALPLAERTGYKRLFVCLVSKHAVKRDDAPSVTPRMRVVGPGGAYPQWVVTYR